MVSRRNVGTSLPAARRANFFPCRENIKVVDAEASGFGTACPLAGEPFAA